MPRPPQEVEFLQQHIRQWMNREIRDYFRDLAITDTWDPDLTSPRSSLAAACMHQDSDSLIITQLRCWFFDQIRYQNDRVPYYGVPITSFQESRKFAPQIKLFFKEDYEDVEPGFSPIRGEISFRLMGETTESITPTIAQTYATRIKNTFGVSGAGYIWRRGKMMATYNDWKKGYSLQLLVRSEVDARELVSKVLAIQSDTISLSKMNVSENQAASEAYPTLPETDYIYGETRRLPRRRPIADVRFQYGLLHVHGLANPIVLYDRSYTYPSALETVA